MPHLALKERAVSRRILFAVGLAAVLVPARAAAVDAIQVGVPSFTAQYHTVHFRIPYTGDDNRNATVLVRYSRSRTFQASGADTAVVPFRDVSLHRFTGVILWLEPGGDYAIRVDVTDPDGGSTTYLPAYITPRIAPGHTVPPNRVFVAPSGDDRNPGTLSAPKRTIMGGVQAVTLGGQVRVLPGIYHETVWLQADGFPSQYFSLVGHGDPDSVIIDGSEPELLQAKWSRYLEAGGVWATGVYWIRHPRAPLVNHIVAGWAQRLHRKQSFAELRWPSLHPSLPAQGWWKNGDTLFVRLEGGRDPSTTTMHVAVRQHGLRVTGNYWRAESLSVRFTGDKGYFLGAWDQLDSAATGTVLRHCRGYSIGQEAVFGNVGTDWVLVDSCHFEDGRIDRWSYAASKARFEETATGLTAVGRGWVIRHSTFAGHSNGIQVSGSAGDSLAKNGGADADVYGNLVLRMADDGIENDLSHGVNQVIWGNQVRECNYGLSAVPMFTGPVYVMYNDFDGNDAGAIKLGGGSNAHIVFAHNTLTSPSCHSAVVNVGGRVANLQFRNNVFVSPDEPGCGRLPLSDFAGEMDTTVTAFGPIFDHNLWCASVPSDRKLVWRGIPRPWSYLRDVLGWEANGLAAEPAFMDSSGHDLRPTGDAAQVDRGVRLQGINTRHLTGAPLYQGRPDLGAHEFGMLSPNQPALPVPGDAGLRFGLGPSWPNPTRVGASLRLSLPAASRVQAVVLDVAGRHVADLAEGPFGPGVHTLRWDSRRRDGSRAAPGVYFVRVVSDAGSAVRRLVLLD